MKYFVSALFFLIASFSFSQQEIKGKIIDIDTKVPLAFAKISYNNTTVTCDWEGLFAIIITNYEKPLIVKYKGYYDKSYLVSRNALYINIKMVTDVNEEKTSEIYTDQKINNIVKQVIENKNKNQPEKVYKNLQYNNYEVVQVSANPDSINSKIDTIYKKNLFGKTKILLDSSNYKFKNFIEKQHLYQTEKINHIQYKNDSRKETILAARMAGLKQPLYQYLGLNLVSYSVYENPFEILEIQMQNPLSSFGRKLYNFYLIDTVTVNNRKAYRIFFQPKKLKSNRLRGILYIDVESYAVAKAFYRIYGVAIIEANFDYKYLEKEGIWFPEKQTLLVKKGAKEDDLTVLGKTVEFNSTMKTRPNSNASDQIYLKLESKPYNITFDKKNDFDLKGIAIHVPDNNLTKSDAYWKENQFTQSDSRRFNTYASLDSISNNIKLEKKLFLGLKVINGYFPVSVIDIDLRSLIKYNNFEGFRVGFGGKTNSKLSEIYKVDFYGAYGFKDDKFKYSITPSYLLNRDTETWLSAGYTDDLSEIGRFDFPTDSRRFKLYDPRPINISTFYREQKAEVFVESKIIPKTDAYFGISNSKIDPKFDYTFINNGLEYTNYSITAFQYSMQWNPFSRYMKTPKERIEIEKKHPKFSFQVIQTLPDILNNDFQFTKLDFKTYYEMPYLSGQKSALLFQLGYAFGDIPLTHLYSLVPNNLNRDAILQRVTFAGKNSFETMYFNEFFSDKFVAVHLKHTFNKVRLAYKINPEFTVVTRFALGNINKANTHVGLPFASLEKGFFESGVEANKIYSGFGVALFYRYGNYQLPTFEDNIAIKVSYFLDLGF